MFPTEEIPLIISDAKVSAAGKTTVFLDPSAIKESGCILRLYRMVVQGYTSKVFANDMEFGSAFHCYRKAYVEAQFAGETDEVLLHAISLKSALNYWDNTPMWVKFNKKHLTRGYLEQTCYSYQQHYKTHGDEYEVVSIGKEPLVEKRVPYPYFVTPEGDIEFILCGTLDLIVRHRGFGFFAVKDYKTTSLWDKQKYFDSYKLSPQMLGYKLLLKKYTELYPDSTIAKVYNGNLQFVIDGIFLGATGATFECSAPIPYPDSMLEEFEQGLMIIIQDLVKVIRNPKLLYRQGMLNSSCEKVYGPCSQIEVCAAHSNEERQSILTEKFIQRPYNPLTHGELKV